MNNLVYASLRLPAKHPLKYHLIKVGRSTVSQRLTLEMETYDKAPEPFRVEIGLLERLAPVLLSRYGCTGTMLLDALDDEGVDARVLAEVQEGLRAATGQPA